jgi:hypothetical protein
VVLNGTGGLFWRAMLEVFIDPHECEVRPWRVE